MHGSPQRTTVRFPLASFMTSSLTVSLCCSILENYPQQITGTHGTRRLLFFFFLMKDIPLRASLYIDSSEEVCSWGDADGYWKLNPSSAILIWVDVSMGNSPKFIPRSPMPSLDKDGKGLPPAFFLSLAMLLTLPQHASLPT